MTIEERDDGTILVTYDSTRLTWLMLAVGGVCLATAGYDVFIGSRGTDRLAGLLGAAGTCLLVAIVFLERAWFQFALATRIVCGAAAGRCASDRDRYRSALFSRCSLSGRSATMAPRAANRAEDDRW